MGVGHLTSQSGDNGDNAFWAKPAPQPHPFGGLTAGGGHGSKPAGQAAPMRHNTGETAGGKKGGPNIGGQPFKGKQFPSAGRAG